MTDYMKELEKTVKEYTDNKRLEYEIKEGLMKVYYEGEHFVDFGESGWMYPINLSENADLNNFKTSNSAYKIFYISEIMLRVVGILNRQ